MRTLLHFDQKSIGILFITFNCSFFGIFYSLRRNQNLDSIGKIIKNWNSTVVSSRHWMKPTFEIWQKKMWNKFLCIYRYSISWSNYSMLILNQKGLIKQYCLCISNFEQNHIAADAFWKSFVDKLSKSFSGKLNKR